MQARLNEYLLFHRQAALGPCASNPCNDRGHCIETKNFADDLMAVCICQEKWTGSRCHIPGQFLNAWTMRPMWTSPQLLFKRLSNKTSFALPITLTPPFVNSQRPGLGWVGRVGPVFRHMSPRMAHAQAEVYGPWNWPSSEQLGVLRSWRRVRCLRAARMSQWVQPGPQKWYHSPGTLPHSLVCFHHRYVHLDISGHVKCISQGHLDLSHSYGFPWDLPPAPTSHP